MNIGRTRQSGPCTKSTSLYDYRLPQCLDEDVPNVQLSVWFNATLTKPEIFENQTTSCEGQKHPFLIRRNKKGLISSFVVMEPNIEPVIYSPLTRFTLGWFNYQSTKCAGYELDYYDCAMRVSKTNAKEICWKQYHDLIECAKGWKQIKRYEEMSKERKKQGRPYLPTPPADVIPPSNPY